MFFFRVHLCNTLANLYVQFEIIFIIDLQKCNPIIREKVTIKLLIKGLTLLALNWLQHCWCHSCSNTELRLALLIVNFPFAGFAALAEPYDISAVLSPIKETVA